MIRDMVERAGNWYAGRIIRTMEDFGLAMDVPRVKADSPDAKPIRLHARSDRAKRQLANSPRFA